ncbi:SPARC-related modular calcium-binding protein 2 isoform X3 [Linepithema humile]|uniref:SPARC-related modular calcium-binding protein 2 isoform X3 n=1 Tax=Linepithema humile TaxID=83485 RepID=UPI0006238ACB|nr:PREDICTED: SPARC-related modular calcium-binding protein 2 isoform X3 [Linepithema humile]
MMFPIRIVLLFLLVVDIHAAANSVISAKKECRKRIAECTMNGGGNTPVCGSDGITYSSQCQVISKQCQGISILIKHTGSCPETPACFSARLTARSGAQPVCRSDGTYAPVQCHMESGYCWCVTKQGRPLPDTSVRHQKPRCSKLGSRSAASTRNGQRRRSPSWKQRRQYVSNRHRNTCDRSEKSKFHENLIENFKIEYRRINISVDDDKNVEQILSWKFITLDKDGDGFLDRAEYKELRRLAKKAVRPKKCARTFARTCDLDRDLKLSRQEWGACLANDFTLLKGSPAPIHSLSIFNDDVSDTKDTTEESDAADCISDQKSALEDQKKNSKGKYYIPDCTSDGRYRRVQCYSGYCWCVYEDTGKPIPGTSSKDHTPNCYPVPTPSRPMKGCPEMKKQQFLRDLMNLMLEKMMASNTDSDETTAKWQTSKEEHIATWHFVMLDNNKNKVLERKEWKSFRTMVANNMQLRRCGKKLPRYCDINNDRKISMTEWYSCLNIQHPATANDPEKTSTSTPRRGPNPIDLILYGD